MSSKVSLQTESSSCCSVGQILLDIKCPSLLSQKLALTEALDWLAMTVSLSVKTFDVYGQLCPGRLYLYLYMFGRQLLCSKKRG